MKKIFTLLLIFTTVALMAVAKVELFRNPKSTRPFEGVGKVETGTHMWLLFKADPKVKNPPQLTSFYIFADRNAKTGRKGVGNEYYFNLKNGNVTVYAPDGTAKTYRKAVKRFAEKDWQLVAIDKNALTDYKLNEFSVYWNHKPYRASVQIGGSASSAITVEAPVLPEFNAPQAAPKVKSKKTAAKAPAAVPAAKFTRPVRNRAAKAGIVPPKNQQVISWISGGLRRVYSVANDYNGKKEITVRSARNAIVDFNIAIFYGVRKKGQLHLTWDVPTPANGKKLHKNTVRLYKVGSRQLMVPADPRYHHAIKGIPGNMLYYVTSVPEVLSRYQQGRGTGDYKRTLFRSFNVFHGKVSVPADAKPGIYTVNFTLTYPGGKEQFKLHINVDKFTLPERPSFVMFADLPRLVNYRFDGELGAEHRGYNNLSLDLEACLRNFKEHRVAPRKMLAGVPLKFSADGTPILDFTAMDKFCTLVIDELKMNPRFEMPLATVSTGHSANYTKLFGPVGRGFMSDEFKKKYTATIKAVHEHIKAKKWQPYFLAYFADEPAGSEKEQTIAIAKMIKAVDPELDPWIFGPGPNMAYIDVFRTWMAGFGAPLEDGEIQMDDTNPAVKIAKERGDRIGLYNPHPAYLLTRNLGYTRSLYWWVYQRQLSWMNMYCLGYFRGYSAGSTNKDHWNTWVYPPANKSQYVWDDSLRWEATRAGLTDYEYLAAIEKRTAELKKIIPAAANLNDRAIALEFANALCQSKNSRCDDTDRVLFVAGLLANELQQMSDNQAMAHYEFKESKVILHLFATPGTVVTFDGKTQTVANEPLVFTFDAKAAADKTFTFELNDGKKKTTISKTILLPYQE